MAIRALRGQVSIEAMIAIAAVIALIVTMMAASQKASESLEVAGREGGKERMEASALLGHEIAESGGVRFHADEEYGEAS